MLLAGFQINTIPDAFAANGESIFGITTGNNLVKFNSETPGTIDFEIPITGLGAGESASAIDFRPANNTLYLLSNNDTLYTLNVESGAATAVGTSLGLTGTKVGIDVNPAADAIRYISNADENGRINATTGALISADTVLAYDAGDVNNGVSPNVVAAAYTASSPSQTVTTLFVIDSATNTLVRQGSPNGTPTGPNSGTLFTVGSLGVDPTDNVGFDIAEAKSGTAYASMVLQGEAAAKLFSVELGGGHATLIGTISSATSVVDIAVQRAGAVRFDQVTYSVGENAGNLSVVVERVGGSSNSFSSGASVPATINISTANGSAIAGQDYTAQTNTVVTFGDGEVSKTVSIPVLDDTALEAAEAFTVTLSSPTNGLILADSGTSTVTINDNDTTSDTAAPTVTLVIAKQTPKSTFLSRGLRFDATCNEACTLTMELTVANGIVNRFKLDSASLATGSATLTAGTKQKVTIRPESAIRRKLNSKPGAIPVTVTIIATDVSGNAGTTTKRVVIQDNDDDDDRRGNGNGRR